MKISKESYNLMKKAMEKTLNAIIDKAISNKFNSSEQSKGYNKETFLLNHTQNGLKTIKDPVFYVANLLFKWSVIEGYPTTSHFICDVIYDAEGCNDTHLKTVLKKIWGEL